MDEQKQEALKRMKKLKISEDAIEAYEKQNKLMCSEKGNIIDVPEDILKKLRAWEKKYHNLVYHVIHAYIYGLETYECLSVSKYPEDWGYENMRLDENWPMSYSINLTIPDFSESGTILVENYKGVLMRLG